ncbi:TPA: gfo/Idh/MocA family oxidoreductase, partial [Vibrio vulnificus]|nr:gfo/Idh/MocA family oxidoreductase [Vibrio vulnificus]
GHLWQQGQQTKLALKDWTPMLTSKGFTPMLRDWVKVVECGQLASEIVERNIASHQLAEAIYQKIAKAL